MRLFVLTGAGVSAESGLGTFRDEGGLWARHAIEDVATPDGFARNPGLVHEFYNTRRADARAATPNPAHVALARLGGVLGDRLTLCTQNVDDLHERAGSPVVWHVHGQLAGALCAACAARWPAPERMRADDPCPTCGQPATRPDVVWFGEMPHHLDPIAEDLQTCDLFVAIGTSGEVHPAAGFVAEARAAGAETLELNLEPSAGATLFESGRYGPATSVVPAWVSEVLDRL